MMSGLLIFVSWIVGALCETSFAPPEFTIDMSLPADQRWAAACKEFGTIDKDIYDNFVKFLPEFMVDDVEAIMVDWYNKNAEEPYKSELAYFAQCSGVPLGGIITINLLYDMTAFCTSIVAEDENGVIYHGRNLDYSGVPLLRNATMIAHFTNGTDDILYTTTVFFGYSGMWTGVRRDGDNSFTISADERDQGDILSNIMGIKDDYYPPSWLIRDTLSNRNNDVNNYNDALNKLVNSKLMAPVYFIIGGTKYPDGAVITRNQTYSFNLWPLATSYLDWYDVETNYDWWTPAPTSDDRRDPAIKSMNEMGQNNLNAMNLYNVLSQPPVLNKGTLYTTIMSAYNDTLYYTMVREP